MRTFLRTTLVLAMLSSMSWAGGLLVVAPRAFSGAVGDFIACKNSRLPTAGWYPPSIFFQGMKFMLFGDPSLDL